MRELRKPPAPWLFSLLILPLGVVAVGSLLCMIRLDGFGFSRFGTHGMFWTDAGANLLVFGVVAVIFMAYGLKLRRVADSHAMASASTIS